MALRVSDARSVPPSASAGAPSRPVRSPGPGDGEPGARGSRAALAGIVFAGLFAVGLLLLQSSSPSIDATDAELLRYIDSPGRRRSSLIAALYIVPIAAIAFIWFVAAFRDRVVRAGGREHTMLATVHLMAATLFVSAMFLVAAVELALVWRVDAAGSGGADVEGARALIAIGTAMSQLIALRAGAVFIAVSTTRAVRSGLFPRWFGAASFVIAATLLLAGTTWRPIVFAVPAWVLASSCLVLARRRDRDGLVDA